MEMFHRNKEASIRAHRGLALLVVLAGALSSPAQAQPVVEHEAAAARAPGHQLGLEVTPLAGTLSYAVRIAANSAAGIAVGGGYDLAMVPLAGGHFASDRGFAYEDRDGASGKEYRENVHLALFLRHFLPRGWLLETGLRAAQGTHSDSSDDDSGAASFLGGYAGIFWGGSMLSVGTRLSAGALQEPGGVHREFGLVVHPIILKVTTR